MKEIIQALESRIKSPIVGYFTLSFLLYNWQEIFFLLVDKSSAAERIKYFLDNTSQSNLLWYPLLFATVYTLLYPWINLVFLYLCRKPTDIKNSLQAKSEHKLLVEKNELENIRSKYLATTEQSIIEQAKRDLEINKIEDQELKDSVKSTVGSLRSNQAISIENQAANHKLESPEELFKMADQYRQRAQKSSLTDATKWQIRATALEEKAHVIVSGENA